MSAAEGDNTTVVLDISSDDDVWGGDDAGSGLADGGDDGDWLSVLLGEVDKRDSGEAAEDKGNDSDEVEVVGEVFANPRRSKTSSVKCVTNAAYDDDDDCVLLDGDPDKPPSVQNYGDDDSDDLVVVGETGQVACRDYPHARHLCVKYPFDSTPHESHCDQCHCYVCDSLAPCLHWSIAFSSTDHCHATEKDEFWKTQRKSAKNGSLPMIPGIPNVQSPPYQIPPSLPFDNGQKFYMPNTTTCAMTQQKLQPQLVSQQLQNNLMNVSRTHIGVNVASRVISRRPVRRTISSVHPLNPTHGQCYNAASRGRDAVEETRHSRPTGVWHRVGTQVPASYQDPSRANIAATNLLPAQQNNSVNGTGNLTPRVQMIPQARKSVVQRNKYVLQSPVPAYDPQAQVLANMLQAQVQACVPQPQVQAYVPQPQVQAYVPQPQVQAYVPQPQVQAYVPQPQVQAYVPQPQVQAYVPQPQVQAYVPQPQVQAYVAQPQVPTYVAQPQVPTYVAQPQVPTYAPQPQVPAYAPQHQVPPPAPQLQVPAGLSGVASLKPMQPCSMALNNTAGNSVSDSNNSSAYQSQPQLNVSVQGNPSPSPIYSPKDGNVAAPLSNNGQSSTAPGDLNQSTTGFEINLDYDYSTGHSNQTLPVDQVQKAVQIDELDSIPGIPTYNSPSPPVYPFDPWGFENEPGLDGFGNSAMDVVIDANLFDF